MYRVRPQLPVHVASEVPQEGHLKNDPNIRSRVVTRVARCRPPAAQIDGSNAILPWLRDRNAGSPCLTRSRSHRCAQAPISTRVTRRVSEALSVTAERATGGDHVGTGRPGTETSRPNCVARPRERSAGSGGYHAQRGSYPGQHQNRGVPDEERHCVVHADAERQRAGHKRDQPGSGGDA